MIGGLSSADSYLRIDKILDAARRSGADAVHPGYGFLSENAGFAEAVIEAGLTWVGPPAQAIRIMGDKARARARAFEAGLPVTPGYDGADQDPDLLRGEAARIGYPVMVKAAAGGGGRGIRFVAGPDDLDVALASAASEAAKSFGDARLLLEKAVVRPRHVEVQVFADVHGGAVHLFERDCSVQRRHQKVIEEAPSPALSDALRTEMGEAAVKIAREIDYVGAGTVEFLVDAEGAFYFMEMNTRLQVEHPVTEMITGLDLVAWQLQVAAGEPLPLQQDQIRRRGWAMEARLCAEDPAQDYTPRTGPILAWRPAASARNDHALAAGQAVTPYFDSMLGKVIVHGRTRTEACDRLQAALDATVVLGVPTNRALLSRIVRDPIFREGADVSTAFLADRFPEPSTREPAVCSEAWALAAWLSATAEADRWRTPEGWRDWSSTERPPAPWRLRIDRGGITEERRGLLTLTSTGATVTWEGGESKIDGLPGVEREPFVVRCGATTMELVYAWSDQQLWVHLRPLSPLSAEATTFSAASLRRAASRMSGAADAANTIVSPMNGLVLKVLAEPGQAVERGQVLVVMEAMKMEHNLKAPMSGRVRAVHAQAGDQVAPRRLLVELEAEEAAA